MKHYLYRHIRLDKNEVFYVGVGTKSIHKFRTFTNEFKRAHSIKDRSKWWKRIYNKTEILIEILIESNDYDFIERKEIEFIALYGRKDKSLGTLVNMTDGGVAGLGRGGKTGKLTKKDIIDIFQAYNKGNTPKEIAVRFNIRKNQTIAILNKKAYIKYSQDLKKSIHNRLTNIIIRNGKIKWLSKYKNYAAISEYFNLQDVQIGRISKDNSIQEVACPELLKLIRERKKHIGRCVSQYTKQGKFIKKFKTLKDAAISVNGSSSPISSAITGRLKTAYGYIWK